MHPPVPDQVTAAARVVADRNILLAELLIKAAFREPGATWQRKVELACHLGRRFRKAVRPEPAEFEVFRQVPVAVLIDPGPQMPVRGAYRWHGPGLPPPGVDGGES